MSLLLYSYYEYEEAITIYAITIEAMTIEKKTIQAITMQAIPCRFSEKYSLWPRELHFQPAPPKVHPVAPREIHGCSQFWKRAGSEFPASGVWPLSLQPAGSGVWGA